jgi:hypothetical protein
MPVEKYTEDLALFSLNATEAPFRSLGLPGFDLGAIIGTEVSHAPK